MKRSLPARAGAALVALAAMTVAVAAAKIELAKPDQVADAQAQIKASGLSCDVGKVRFGGEGDMKNKDKKSIHVQVYEVTCNNGLGYMVEGPKGGSADTMVSSCASLMSQGKKGDSSNSCQFPENQDVKGQIQAIMSKAGASCTVEQAKWIGVNVKDRAEGFEVACAAPSPGYVLFVPQTTGSELRTTNCMMGGYKCTLTTPEQQTAWVKSIAGQSSPSCDINKSRYVGTDKDGSSFFEVGCAKGAGFMFTTNAAGAYKSTIACSDASNIAGGCTLTDKALVQASGAESWGQKLKAAGVACNVQQARLIGTMSGKRDVVEYQCSDRPAGLLVGLPNQPGQKADVVDCFDAHHFGTKCQFTSADVLNQILAKALTASGRSCAVSAFQNLGGYENGSNAFEVACGSAPGFIAVLPADYSKPSQVQTCAEAAKTANRTGISCSLPGNS